MPATSLHRRVRSLIVLASGVLLALPTASASAAPSAQETVDDPYPSTSAAAVRSMRSVLKSTNASSISMALVDANDIAWRRAVGSIDESGTRPDAATIYGIGSVSKMLTTVAVMQLVDAGKVSLDKPVVNYVTDFRMADAAFRQITVKMLLNHSAGLPGTDYANSATTTPFGGYATQVLGALRSARLKTTPGSMNVYCNDCFTLAAIVVERVSGVPFTQYVHDNITAPLAMDRSGYSLNAPPPADFAAVLTPYGPLPHEYMNAYASGGFYSTTPDMSHLAMMLANGGSYRGKRLLSASSVSAMAANQVETTLRPVNPGAFAYGLGWDTVSEPALASLGVQGWEKGGDTGQFHAAFLVAPEEGLSVTVLAAGAAVSSGDLETLAQFALLQALAERGDLTTSGAAADEPPAHARPTLKHLRAIQGSYLASGLQARVAVNPDDSLTLSLNTTGEWTPIPAEFTYRTDGRFWAEEVAGYSLEISRAWDRAYLVWNLPGEVGSYMNQLILGQRVTPTAPLSEAWQSRVGRRWAVVNELPSSFLWFAMDATSFATVENLPGYLTVSGIGGRAPIDPAASDSVGALFAVIPGLQGRDLNDIVVFPNEGQEWLRIGSSILRPLDGVPALTGGTEAVPIGAEGYAEFRSVPAASTLTIAEASEWKLLDAGLQQLDGGIGNATGVTAQPGTYLVVFGPAGTTVAVTTR
jgi:CubicO group peptidase (beta-lactamase class C family)